jgi:hypothetical protein
MISADERYGMNSRSAYTGTFELRSERRFKVALPVGFEWAMKGSPTKHGKGISQDISVRGVYLTTRMAPQIGARVLLEIDVPKLSGTGVMHLQGEGSIVRVEKAPAGCASSETGFAASVHFHAETSREILSMLVRRRIAGARASSKGAVAAKGARQSGLTILSGQAGARRGQPSPEAELS